MEDSELTELVKMLEYEARLGRNLSAHQYLSSLNQYLSNITLVPSYPRQSDAIPLDKSAGLLWVIIIPVLYFLSVALILGILLGYFWYTDKTDNVSEEQSEEASSSNPVMNNVRPETAFNLDNHPPNEFVRSYNSDVEKLSSVARASITSKGSIRSFGVLTQSDLEFPIRTSLRSTGLTKHTRRLSRSIPEADDPLSRTVRPGDRHKSGQGQRLEMSDKAIALIKASSKNRSLSLSTDSLEENISRDSLRASMDSHKLVWMSDGEIGPDDLYGTGDKTQERKASDMNGKAPGASDNKENQDGLNSNVQNKTRGVVKRPDNLIQQVFNNPLFSTGSGHHEEVNDHLKKSYEAAVEMDSLHAASSFETESRESPSLSHDQRLSVNKNSSSSAASQLPGKVLLGLDDPVSRYQSDIDLKKINKQKAKTVSGELQVKKSVFRRLFTSNAGTNVQEVVLPTFHAPEQRNNHSEQLDMAGLNFNVDDSTTVQFSSQVRSFELSADTTDVVGYHFQYSQEDHYHPQEYQHQYETEMNELDISSASRLATTSSSDFDNNRSLDSGEMGVDESSLDSATMSLPSSICRFHARKAGQYPTPTAGYPIADTYGDTSGLADTTAYTGQTDVQDDEHFNDSTSLFANVGSCSQSTAALSGTFESFENSLLDSKNNGPDAENSGKKASRAYSEATPPRRPSPGANVTSRFPNKMSFDDSFLMRQREDTTQMRSPLLTVSKSHRRRHSLDFLTCGKVSIEQRLKEFGFIKAKGKHKYFINPSPGKFANRIGSVNYTFTDGEEEPILDIKSSLDRDIIKETDDSGRNISLDGKLAQSERARAKPVLPTVMQVSSNSFHVPNNLENSSFWQHRQKGIQHSTQIISSNSDRARDVIEIHGEHSELCNKDAGDDSDYDEQKGKDDEENMTKKQAKDVLHSNEESACLNKADTNASGIFKNEIRGATDAKKQSGIYEKGEFPDGKQPQWAQKWRGISTEQFGHGSQIPQLQIKGALKNVTKLGHDGFSPPLLGHSLIPVRTAASANKSRYPAMKKQQSSRVLDRVGLLDRPQLQGNTQATNSNTHGSNAAFSDSQMNDFSSEIFSLMRDTAASRHNEKQRLSGNKEIDNKDYHLTMSKIREPVKEKISPRQQDFSDEDNNSPKLANFGENRVSTRDFFRGGNLQPLNDASQSSDFFSVPHASLMTPSISD